METGETEKSYPFKVSFDKKIDMDSVTFKVVFKNSFAKKDKLEMVVKNWAEKGIDEGYGEGKMHYLEDAPDEFGEGGFEWNKEDGWVEFFADMGSSSEKVFDALFNELAQFDGVKEVKIGSGYEW